MHKADKNACPHGAYLHGSGATQTIKSKMCRMFVINAMEKRVQGLPPGEMLF